MLNIPVSSKEQSCLAVGSAFLRRHPKFTTEKSAAIHVQKLILRRSSFHSCRCSGGGSARTVGAGFIWFHILISWGGWNNFPKKSKEEQQIGPTFQASRLLEILQCTLAKVCTARWLSYRNDPKSASQGVQKDFFQRREFTFVLQGATRIS